jgi:hypothetical protein
VIATRRLDEDKITPLPGTEAHRVLSSHPMASWIGFFANRSLKKILVQGGCSGTPGDRSDIPRWNLEHSDGDSIIAALGNQTPLSRVAAAGGSTEPLTHLEGGRGLAPMATDFWTVVARFFSPLVRPSLNNIRKRHHRCLVVEAKRAKTRLCVAATLVVIFQRAARAGILFTSMTERSFAVTI